MKQIKVLEIYPPDNTSDRALRKLYKIPMPGQSYDFYFKNKKEALRFAAGFSRHLTKTMHEMNYFTGELYKNYRLLWPFIHQADFKFYFKDVDDRFDMLTGSASVHFIYSEMNTIFYYLDLIVSGLVAVAVKNKQYNTKHHLSTIKKILDEIDHSREYYGAKSRYRVDYDVKKLS